ncbi:MAG: cytochrome c oxidase subunit II [Chloroflexota bacterium]
MARTRIRVLLRTGALLALVLLATACGMVPPEPHTKEAKEVFWLYNVVLVMGAIVFVGVEGFILYSVVRYRRRDDRLPTQVHGNNLVEVIWTLIPTVIVLILFVLSTLTLNSISQAATHPGVSIDVEGKQWSWVFHYLDDDNDPTNDVIVQGTARSGGVMVLPIGEPIHLKLVSNDVIHSFFVPAFLVKRDLVPLPEAKDPNTLEFTVTEKGTYAGQCAEFCGDLHAQMTFSVQAVSRADFDIWIEAARSGESPPPPSVGADAPVLKLSAANIAFDTHDLEVAAGQAFKIELVNNDDVDHNVGIYKGDDELFRGNAVSAGKTVTYLVDALEAGEYTFTCDFHPGPAMTGTLTVK